MMCREGHPSLNLREKRCLCYQKFFLLLTKLRTLLDPSINHWDWKLAGWKEGWVLTSIQLHRWEPLLPVARNRNNTIYKTEHFPLLCYTHLAFSILVHYESLIILLHGVEKSEHEATRLKEWTLSWTRTIGKTTSPKGEKCPPFPEVC